jgi:hypothetical protein
VIRAIVVSSLEDWFFSAGELCKFFFMKVGWRLICSTIMYRKSCAYNMGQLTMRWKNSMKTFNFTLLTHLKNFDRPYRYHISLKSSWKELFSDIWFIRFFWYCLRPVCVTQLPLKLGQTGFWLVHPLTWQWQPRCWYSSSRNYRIASSWVILQMLVAKFRMVGSTYCWQDPYATWASWLTSCRSEYEMVVVRL